MPKERFLNLPEEKSSASLTLLLQSFLGFRSTKYPLTKSSGPQRFPEAAFINILMISWIC